MSTPPYPGLFFGFSPSNQPTPFPHRYEQLTLRADALREELHSKTERILNDIIKFKVHVQKSLEDLEGLVVEEVERELGGEGEGEGGEDAEAESGERSLQEEVGMEQSPSIDQSMATLWE